MTYEREESETERNPHSGRRRTIFHGQAGESFFNRETLELISESGTRPIDLVGLLSAYGLHVSADKIGSLFQLLHDDEHGLKDVLTQSPEGNLLFPAKDILTVAGVIERSLEEPQVISALVGGKDSVDQARQLFLNPPLVVQAQHKP